MTEAARAAGEREGDAMAVAGSLIVFEDERFTVVHEATCSVPGYLIVRLRDGSTSYGDLAPETAQALGALLARAQGGPSAASVHPHRRRASG